METQEREERYVVQRPVVETAEREQCSTVVEPVTTYPHRLRRPGQLRRTNAPSHPGRTYTGPALGSRHDRLRSGDGSNVTQRGGLAWVPFQGPAVTTVNRVWQPNVGGRADAANHITSSAWCTQKVPVSSHPATCPKKWSARCRSRSAGWCKKQQIRKSAGQHRPPGDRAGRAASSGAGLQNGRRGSRSARFRSRLAGWFTKKKSSRRPSRSARWWPTKRR